MNKPASLHNPYSPEQTVLSRAGLSVVRNLLDHLHTRGIVYCHWKSNEHVGPAIEGLTDLDILVDRRQHMSLQRCLAECGFLRFAAASQRSYPAVEDHLAFDAATGRIVHLHLHYRLTLGQKHLKGYRLPWEDRVLERRTYDEVHGIYVADPVMETVLLLVRGGLKRRLRDDLKVFVGHGSGNYSRRELAWLRERVEPQAVRDLAADLMGVTAAAALGDVLAAPDVPGCERRLARAVRVALRRDRTYGPASALVRGWWRELQWLADAVNRRILHRAVPLRRVDPRGGLVVAFLGSDGAGKSTLVGSTAAWLGVKLDVLPLYFGSGDGPGSLLRLPLTLARRLAPPVLIRRDRTSAGGSGGRGRDRLRSAALVPWALTLALEKRAKLRRMTQARNRGMIVLCDRFPQTTIAGFNDGPLLDHLRISHWRIGRALAEWETGVYRQADATAPDLVIKLVASPAIALTRRPDMSEQEIVRRIEAVRSLNFPPSTRVEELSGDEALKDVILAVRRIIWHDL